MTLLRDPQPAPESGGAAPNQAQPTANGQQAPATPPAQTPHPDFARPPAGPGETRPAPVWVDPAEYQRQQAEMRTLREFKAEQERVKELAESEALRARMNSKEAEDALAAQKTRYETKLTAAEQRAQLIETKWLSEKRTTEIDRALAGRSFGGVDPKATAALVRRLLADEIEAVTGAEGDPVIRERVSKRPAAEYLAERLESPELAIFFKASTGGGAGTDGTRPAAATPKPPGDPNQVFAEQFRQRLADARAARF